MEASVLIAQMLSQRESWVELEPAGDGRAARRVRIRRPAETEFHQLSQGVEVEHLRAYVVGWDGVTEADALGAGVGASDALPFSADLWVELARDKAEWYRKAARGLIDAVTAYLSAKGNDAKN